MEPDQATRMFEDARWYDRTVNWSARLGREIPVLMEVFGPPGGGGIVDAGCGTGRQALELARRGYRVVGADSSVAMLVVAREAAAEGGLDVAFEECTYAGLLAGIGGGFDGLYCIGNSLAAAGSQTAVREALDQFARCLRPGGRLFIQVLNFALMRASAPFVAGPRVVTTGGVEYVSARVFHFDDDRVQVTNVSFWKDPAWQCRKHSGTLYPVSIDELQAWCAASDLHIDQLWGSYACRPFDSRQDGDLILVATRQ